MINRMLSYSLRFQGGQILKLEVCHIQYLSLLVLPG